MDVKGLTSSSKGETRSFFYLCVVKRLLVPLSTLKIFGNNEDAISQRKNPLPVKGHQVLQDLDCCINYNQKRDPGIHSVYAPKLMAVHK